MMPSPENEDSWAIVYLDSADTDIEAAHRFLAPFVGADKATEWLRTFYFTTANLVDFPGPFAYTIDEEASQFVGRPVRKLLFRGGTKQKPIGTIYRVYFYTVEPEKANERGGVFILRVLHGATEPWPAPE